MIHPALAHSATGAALPGEHRLVVVNDAGQHALWHADVALPIGWHAVQPAVPLPQAVRIVERTWLDQRPRPPAAPPSGWKSLPAAFEERARLSPLKTALRHERRQLTYAALQRQANQLAHRLRAEGVAADSCVALCLADPLARVVGMLATLKAGGAFVPMDPAAPPRRLSFMLGDCAAKVVLTEAPHRSRLPLGLACVIAVDEQAAAIAQLDESSLGADAHPDDLAYVIYTSGSTGQPKGVMVTHGAIKNHMDWMAEAFPLASFDRVLQRTAATFDASVWEHWAPLLEGAQLVLSPPHAGQDPAALAALIASAEITVVQAVPTLLQLLLEQPEFQRCRSLRRIYSGGEALPAATRDRLLALPGIELINLYGPTECTIDATAARCVAGEQGATAAIGAPIRGTVARVLSAMLQPVPAGEVGTLYLGGAGLARGYLARPALTAERFVPDPLSTQPGQRLFNTGDLVRERPDGHLEFLGRADLQVKLHGNRIELEEIEAVLLRQPGVTQAAVGVVGTAGADARLVAWVAARAGKAQSPSALRVALREALPEPMVPSAFVLLPSLPTTAHGKVDRPMLPVPRAARAQGGEAPLAPRTTAERQLAAMFRRHIGITEVGVHEGLFDLGGHSLAVLRIHGDIQRDFGVRLPLETMCEVQTVAGLAQAVQAAQAVLRSAATPDAAQAARRPDRGEGSQARGAPAAIAATGADGPNGLSTTFSATLSNAGLATSIEVRRMYEQHPYPSPVAGESLIHDVAGAVGFLFPDQDLAGWRILDGGCGTGHRLVGLARAYPQAQLTGVDLTPSSLAVARALAERHGAKNVAFQQADLMELELGRKFDFIVSTGVVVCLPDPVAGIRRMLSHLAPDGVLMLWLYHSVGEHDRMIERELAFLLWQDRDDLRQGVAVMEGLGLGLSPSRYGARSAEMAEGDTIQRSLDVDAYLHPIVHTWRFHEAQALLKQAGAEWTAVNSVNTEGDSRLVDLAEVSDDPWLCTTPQALFRTPGLAAVWRTLPSEAKLKAIELAMRPTGFTLLAGHGRSFERCGPRIVGNASTV